MKLHQINISELLTNMKDHCDTNEGFPRHIEKIKKSQKETSTIDVNLIDNAKLLGLGIKAMHDYGCHNKVLD